MYINNHMANIRSNYFNKKFVILGDSAVGKSSICLRYIKNSFIDYMEPTIGAAFFTSDIKIENNIHHLEVWDTAGQERYSSLAPMYYRGAVVALVVYDVTNEKSLHSVIKWIDELNHNADKNITIIVLGNKYDLLNENEMIDTMPSLLDIYKERIHHIFTSSKTGLNIDEVFKMGVKESHSIYLQEKEKEKENKNENENENQKKTINLSYRKSNKSSCCY